MTAKPAKPARAPEGDALLVKRAASGEVAAFAMIYDRYAPTVLALARRIGTVKSRLARGLASLQRVFRRIEEHTP